MHLPPDELGDAPLGNTIELLQEEIDVEKQRTVSGRVRIQSITDVVEERVRQSLDTENVEIFRVPIGRIVTEAPPARMEGDVTILSIVEEVLVVEKRLSLKEELHIRTVRTREDVDVPITLRKQRAVIDRLDPDAETILEEEKTNGL